MNPRETIEKFWAVQSRAEEIIKEEVVNGHVRPEDIEVKPVMDGTAPYLTDDGRPLYEVDIKV